MMHDHQVLIPAAFVSRPNRFVTKAVMGDAVVTCHMPNPGRMWELLYEGTRLYLRKAKDPARKTPYDVVGIERDGVPILLDTQYNNDVAEYLIRNHLIPGWESCRVVKREVTVGDSRFDLLLEQEGQPFYVEVKSCTLLVVRVPCSRTRSPKGAASISRNLPPCMMRESGRDFSSSPTGTGLNGSFLITIQILLLRKPFGAAHPALIGRPFPFPGIRPFTYPEPGKLLMYPETLLAEENQDAGDYFVVLELAENRDIAVGSLGKVHFPKGFYVYVGSAKKIS